MFVCHNLFVLLEWLLVVMSDFVVILIWVALCGKLCIVCFFDLRVLGACVYVVLW